MCYVVRSCDSALPSGPVGQRVTSTLLLPQRIFPRARSGCLGLPSYPSCLAIFPRGGRGTTQRADRGHWLPARRPPAPITTLSMLRVHPLFPGRLELPGRKRARIEFVAATQEVDMETQAGGRPPAFRSLFPCDVNIAGVQLKDGE